MTEKEVWKLLDSIPDPEIPVISVVELGVIRKVNLRDTDIEVTITPTYSGCPAMQRFEKDIETTLKENGFEAVEIKTVLSPAWTTDWMNDEALEKLRKYGIAPPQKGTADKGILFEQGPKEVPCPQCNSIHTVLISQFSSTACKSLYKCNNCQETFDYFKCI